MYEFQKSILINAKLLLRFKQLRLNLGLSIRLTSSSKLCLPSFIEEAIELNILLQILNVNFIYELKSDSDSLRSPVFSNLAPLLIKVCHYETA